MNDSNLLFSLEGAGTNRSAELSGGNHCIGDGRTEVGTNEARVKGALKMHFFDSRYIDGRLFLGHSDDGNECLARFNGECEIGRGAYLQHVLTNTPDLHPRIIRNIEIERALLQDVDSGWKEPNSNESRNALIRCYKVTEK